MRHFEPNRNSWSNSTWRGLLGDFRTPLVPLWWAVAMPSVRYSNYFSKRGRELIKTHTLRDEIENPILSVPNVKLNMTKTLNGLGEAILQNRNDFIDAPIGNPSTSQALDFVGGDLPIHLSCVQKFDEIGLGDMSIEELRCIPIQQFLSFGFSWFQIVDLSSILDHFADNSFKNQLTRLSKPSSTLEDCADFIVEELWRSDGYQLNEYRMEALRRRFGVGRQLETLELVGERFGVTRERVRQIESRFLPYLGQRRWPMSQSARTVIEEMINSDSAEIFESLSETGLSSGEVEWDRSMFLRLLEALGQESAVQSLKGIGQPIDLESAFIQRFRKHRNKIGFIDLRTFVGENGELEEPSRVFKYAEQIFNFAYRSGNFALASDARGSQAQNAVQKQFSVCDEIEGSELIEGIDRVARNRGYGNLPPYETVMDLLKQAGTIREVRPDIFAGDSIEIEGDLKRFLVNAIKNAPGGVANQPELFRQAVVEGFNTSSLVSYLTYEPMIRKFENGLVRLAGAAPTTEAIQNAKNAAKLQTEKGSLEYTISENYEIQVVCILGTSNLNSGVLSPPAALRAILDPDGYSIYCCNQVSFNGRLSLSGSMWYGFQPLFNHIRHDHKVRDGDILSFILRDGKMAIISWE